MVNGDIVLSLQALAESKIGFGNIEVRKAAVALVRVSAN